MSPMYAVSQPKPPEYEYLFIDGAYLRRCLDKWSRAFFRGDEMHLDFATFARGFQKTFYYDCLPARKKKENRNEYEQRVLPHRAYLNSLRNLNGFHVYEGTTSGMGGKARQKQVDIMIAIHMLSHTIRRNMAKVTLLSGDLDFKPLVDALVQEGMYVTLWCERLSTSRELAYSADARRDLNLWFAWINTTKAFKEKYALPNRFSQPGIKEGYDCIRKGTSSLGGEAQLLQGKDGQYMIAYRDFVNEGYFSHCEYNDLEFIESFLKELGVTFEWE